MRLIPALTKLVAVAALPLALASCSASSVVAALDPNANLLTGTQLKALLAPATFFPAGYAEDTSTTQDSGVVHQTEKDASTTKPDCTKLGGTAWIDTTGITGASFAANAYVDKRASTEIAQGIDVFSGSTAGTVITTLGKINVACPSFADTVVGGTVTVTTKSTSGIGDSAVTITETDPQWQEGNTLIAVRVGTAVITVFSSDGGNNGADTATKLAKQLAAAVKGKA